VHLGELAVVAVIERGSSGTQRLHVHMAMQGRVDHQEMDYLWGHGYVFYGDPNKHPGRSSVEKLAAYLAKYLGKELDADDDADGDRADREHRWFHTQGFTPEATSRRFTRPEQAEAWLEQFMSSPGAPASWGQQGIDYVFGRWIRWEERMWWPPPGP